tara:strand:+ start:311 stop:616 length:306 start_codon:yes stop_codon:yes gene_type:complete
MWYSSNEETPKPQKDLFIIYNREGGDLNKHEEICNLYIKYCKKNKILFTEFDDFIKKLIEYSIHYGVKNITKLKTKDLQTGFLLLKENIVEDLKNIHLQNL